MTANEIEAASIRTEILAIAERVRKLSVSVVKDGRGATIVLHDAYNEMSKQTRLIEVAALILRDVRLDAASVEG